MPEELEAPSRSRALRVMLVFLVALLLPLGGAFGFYAWATGAAGPSSPVTIEVPEGATTAEVGELLEERGIIRSSFMFGFVVRMRGMGRDIQAGSYELTTNMRLTAALDVLRAGPPPEELPLSLTIPEGMSVEQVADQVHEQLGIRPRRFIRRANSGDFSLPPYLPGRIESVEGFLFPKTYHFPENVTANDVIDRLLAQFEEEVATLPWHRAERYGLEPHEVVTLASLIEREARFAPDRRKISAVIHNRLEIGMALQIDATVQYALPEHKERLTFDDLDYPSPYNTYLHPGLPPGPIASPGLAAIRAALRPANVDFLYYVLMDPETGEHAFAETHEEFLEHRREAGLG
jgi:UPF0755 protein